MQPLIEQIYNLQKFGIKLGLATTRRLLAKLDNPQRGLNCVHIAGTNGKGSTGAMLEAVALAAGLKVGYYISPHLIKFNERFRLNGRDIDDKDLLALGQNVWAAMGDETCTFFEFTTAMAFVYFKSQQVDLAIMETGMGGRLDATSLCEPVVSIITNIGLDHQQYLGKTVKAIAADKAGIIKPGVPVVHGVRQPSAQKQVEAVAGRLHSPVYALSREIKLKRQGQAFYVQGMGLEATRFSTNLPGYVQADNAALAIATARLLGEQGFKISLEHLRGGLQQVNWPGRLEKMLIRQVPVWLDGAHNPPAASVLRKSIKLIRNSGQKTGPLVMVLGIMADKDLPVMLKYLLPMADMVIFTRPDYERACPANDLAELANNVHRTKSETIPDMHQALSTALSWAGASGQVLVTGSLFTVGQARSHFINDFYS